jgi:hypothetical protein
MSTVNVDRAVAVAHIREQVARIRICATGDRTVLIPAAVRLTVLADEIESPTAPAWLLDMVQAGASQMQAG